ncbi:hypothetical protein MUK42_35183 [Musa troglodytarum]|uniref:Uncharacterized protein n=1 Tax=Musa troglodytarum TaxID=320322 RepID=A0A9E7HKI8_9LILI|nr:hypothetical protein MUK42_35183 [Musa troglodytarum]
MHHSCIFAYIPFAATAAGSRSRPPLLHTVACVHLTSSRTSTFPRFLLLQCGACNRLSPTRIALFLRGRHPPAAGPGQLLTDVPLAFMPDRDRPPRQ